MDGGGEGRMYQLVAREREGAMCSFTISKRISICSNNGLERERERETDLERMFKIIICAIPRELYIHL